LFSTVNGDYLVALKPVLAIGMVLHRSVSLDAL
jgi:hypothetical protein